ncbi:MAG TPA: ATP-binding protein, partial [Tepidisphaeraceae bacterium]|nr:ATP-binding protein [Tepidisphaeraceae bacterium]
MEFPRRPDLSALVSVVHEPRIVLAALTRLRWLAVIGQLAAIVLAVSAFGLRLPLVPIAIVVLATAVSNALLVWLPLFRRPPVWTVQAVLLLDVILLTILLCLTGGPENPFAYLYLIHVAMAVLVLPSRWMWAVVATVAACYGLLLAWHLPLGPLPPRVSAIGSWFALVLVAVLIASFIGDIIHSLRQREHELVTMRDRASRNEHLAALTTLAAGAAHELNTPLGTIAVVARELELSFKDAAQDDPVLEDARLIRREVDRCQTILSRMRVDIGEDISHRTLVSLPDLESRLRQSLDESNAARLRIVRNESLASIHAPPRALEQALLVLLRNGLDASDITKPVTLQITQTNGHVRFEVRDQGCGMSPEMLRRAGQPFFTTKEPGRGMGLGLFLVRLVAQQCGATFAIDSTPGVGTTCVLELSEPSPNNGAVRP